VRSPRFRELHHFRRCGQILQAVVDLHRLPNAQIANREDVRAAQVEHQEHVDGPATEALDSDEDLVDLLVGELRQVVDRQLAVDDVLRQVAQVGRLRSRQPDGAELFGVGRDDLLRRGRLAAVEVRQAA
jgi:hypothetical protein